MEGTMSYWTIGEIEAWLVPSSTLDGVKYLVTHEGGHWLCTCPQFTYRLAPRPPEEQAHCKHILQVLAEEQEVMV